MLTSQRGTASVSKGSRLLAGPAESWPLAANWSVLGKHCGRTEDLEDRETHAGYFPGGIPELGWEMSPPTSAGVEATRDGTSGMMSAGHRERHHPAMAITTGDRPRGQRGPPLPAVP